AQTAQTITQSSPGFEPPDLFFDSTLAITLHEFGYDQVRFGPHGTKVSRYSHPLSYNWKSAWISRNFFYFPIYDRIFYQPYDNTYRPLQEASETRCIYQDYRRIFSMTKDEQERIWYSTIDGVFRLDSNVAVHCPEYGHEGFKWISFTGKYFTGINHRNQLLIARVPQQGNIRFDTVLNHNCIWERAYALDKQHLLFETSEAYRLLELKNSAWSIRLLDNPFLPLHAEHISSNGSDVYFLKDGAVVDTTLEDLKHKSPPPVLLFTAVHIGDQLVQPEKGQSLRLSYDQAKDLSFAFSILSYSDADIRYEYALDYGNAPDWHQTQEEIIHLIAPTWGEYKFRIRAINSAGEVVASNAISMSIGKPLWLQGWVLLLAGLLLALSVYRIATAVLKYRLKKKENRHHAEMRFLKAEYKALNALMNPHFIFNCLNSIQSLINSNDRHAATSTWNTSQSW
ncbi:MAG: histidine kinase, partial [Sphingobacteriales bacterium]